VFDLVVAADVLYERDYPTLVAAAIAGTLAPTGTAIVTDPKRKRAEQFPAACSVHGLNIEFSSVAHMNSGVEQTIDVYELVRVNETLNLIRPVHDERRRER
jgi:hypothetical protein